MNVSLCLMGITLELVERHGRTAICVGSCQSGAADKSVKSHYFRYVDLVVPPIELVQPIRMRGMRFDNQIMLQCGSSL